MPLVYLVSGANRGIGLGIIKQLSERPDTVVFAGTRNPESAQDLKALEQSKSGVVHVVKLTSGDVADNEAALETVKRIAGRLDVVIANAGIQTSYTGLFDTPVADMRSHWDVNVSGPHVLFQQSLPLLRASTRTASNPPKFIILSSTIGSAEFSGLILGAAAYRSSKNAANFIAREMHFEHEKDGLVAFPLCPGSVQTDMVKNFYKDAVDKVVATISMPTGTVEANVTEILKVVDESTRETHGGKFINFEGKSLPW